MQQRLLTIFIAFDVFIFALLTLGGRLNLAEWMKSAFCGHVSILCSLCGHKRADVVSYLANSNSNLPSSIAALGNTKIPVRVFRVRLADILSIFASCSFAKILNSVVTWVSINVIYVAIWVFPKRDKPRQPMRLVYFPIPQTNSNVPKAVCVSSGFPDKRLLTRYKSSKNTCFWIVFQKPVQQFWGNIVCSHAVSPVKKWFGQKPGSVSALAGLRHFNAPYQGCLA